MTSCQPCWSLPAILLLVVLSVFIYLIWQKPGRQNWKYLIYQDCSSWSQTYTVSGLTVSSMRRDNFVFWSGERHFPVAELPHMTRAYWETIMSVTWHIYFIMLELLFFCCVLSRNLVFSISLTISLSGQGKKSILHKIFCLQYRTSSSSCPGDGQTVQTDWLDTVT